MKVDQVDTPELTEEQTQSLHRSLMRLRLALQITEQRGDIRQLGPISEEDESKLDAAACFYMQDAIHEICCALGEAA